MGMIQRSKEADLDGERLDSWKAISKFLGRCSRTVQRWHFEYGMPIHRLGGDTGSVFAYSNELDNWLRNRSQRSSNETVERVGRVLVHSPLMQTPTDRPREHLRSIDNSDSKTLTSAALVVRAEAMEKTISPLNFGIIAKVYREAIYHDFDNVKAFAGLSYALVVSATMGSLPMTIGYPAAKAAARTALEIDPESHDAKCASGWLMMLSERDWHSARLVFHEEATNQDPQCMRRLMGRALLYIAEGCPADASSLLLQASRTDLLCGSAIALRGWCEYLAGRCEKALAVVSHGRACGHSGPFLDAVEALALIQCEDCRKHVPRLEAMAATSPQNSVLQGALGYAYGISGNSGAARRILDFLSFPELQDVSEYAYPSALVLISLNEPDKAIEFLEESYREGSLLSLGFQVDPLLTTIRHDPAYKLLMNRIHYPIPRKPTSLPSSDYGSNLFFSEERPQRFSPTIDRIYGKVANIDGAENPEHRHRRTGS
jgi:hypothetical protein